MASAAAPLSICPHHPTDILSDAKLEARKRRREVRASQRGVSSIATDSSNFQKQHHDAVDDLVTSSSTLIDNDNSTESNKRMKTSTNSGTISEDSSNESTSFKKTSAGKKQQMKYDPDIPMTKEEAAKWRREQRRKRNRESAAASRQRQRDRITELEVHVQDWKSKFECVMERIAHLEQLKEKQHSSSSQNDITSRNVHSSNSASEIIGNGDRHNNSHHQTETDPIMNEHTAAGVVEISPMSCISSASPVTIVSDPVIIASSVISSSSLLDSPVPNPLSSFDITSRVTPNGIIPVSGDEEDEMLLPSNMISRPAVKITDMAALPLLPEVSPDNCVSRSMISGLKLDAIDNENTSFFCRTSSVVTVTEKEIPRVLSDEETDETDFGAFLLDAIDWL